MFTPEDGSGVSGANSFVTVAAADDYWSLRAVPEWAAASEPLRIAALLDATAFITGRYRGSWTGDLYSTTQGLDWPRLAAYDAEGRPLDGVPTQVAAACCEMALESLVNGKLNASLARGGGVKREKIGPIETEFADGASAETTYPVLDALLGAVLTDTGGLYGSAEISLRRG